MLWASSASRALSWLLAVMASIPCRARERLSTCRKAWSSSTISHCSCSDIFRLSCSGCHGLRQIDHHGGSGVAGSGFQVAAQPLDGGIRQKQANSQTVPGIDYIFAGCSGQCGLQPFTVVFDHDLYAAAIGLPTADCYPLGAGGQGIGQQVQDGLVEGGVDRNAGIGMILCPLDRAGRPQQGGGFPQPGQPLTYWQGSSWAVLASTAVLVSCCRWLLHSITCWPIMSRSSSSSGLPWPLWERISSSSKVMVFSGVPSRCATAAADRPRAITCSSRNRFSRNRDSWLCWCRRRRARVPTTSSRMPAVRAKVTHMPTRCSWARSPPW